MLILDKFLGPFQILLLQLQQQYLNFKLENNSWLLEYKSNMEAPIILEYLLSLQIPEFLPGVLTQVKNSKKKDWGCLTMKHSLLLFLQIM